jgi:hypothetical protein
VLPHRAVQFPKRRFADAPVFLVAHVTDIS